MCSLKTRVSDFIYRGFRSKVFRLLYKLFCLKKIKFNRVLFASDSHSQMEGNFKYIFAEIKRQNLDLDCKFMLKKSIDSKKTFKEIVLLAYYIATSRYIIIDDFYPMVYPLKIRGKADLIQVWHAVGAFKKFGYGRAGLPGGPESDSKNHKNYTKVIVSSRNVTEIYAEGFGISNDKVLPIGVPRTDVFFDEHFISRKKTEIYSKYPTFKNKKVILFAPTFRGSGQNSAYYPLEELNFSMLYNNLKDDYVFLIKLHPFVTNNIKIPDKYKSFFYNFYDYNEINDLLFITDVLVTDYSSICFEFALLNKPMLFFAFDLKEYTNQRNFYFEYKSFIPGNLVDSTEEMVERIIHEDFSMVKVKSFVNYFFEYVDGRSSKRFVDQILGERNM